MPGRPGFLALWPPDNPPSPWPPAPPGPLLRPCTPGALNPGPPEPLALALALGLALLFSPAIPRKKNEAKQPITALARQNVAKYSLPA